MKVYLVEMFNNAGEIVFEAKLGAVDVGDLLVQINETFHIDMMAKTKGIMRLDWSEIE